MSQGWGPHPRERGPYELALHAHTQERSHEHTARRWPSAPKGKVLPRHQPWGRGPLILDFQPLENERLLFKPRSVVFCCNSQRRLIHTRRIEYLFSLWFAKRGLRSKWPLLGLTDASVPFSFQIKQFSPLHFFLCSQNIHYRPRKKSLFSPKSFLTSPYLLKLAIYYPNVR